jgi:hypothetical protein
VSSVPFIFATEPGLELSVMVAPSTLLTLPLNVGARAFSDLDQIGWFW